MKLHLSVCITVNYILQCTEALTVIRIVVYLVNMQYTMHLLEFKFYRNYVP